MNPFKFAVIAIALTMSGAVHAQTAPSADSVLWSYQQLIVQADDLGDLLALQTPLHDRASLTTGLKGPEFLDFLADGLLMKP